MLTSVPTFFGLMLPLSFYSNTSCLVTGLAGPGAPLSSSPLGTLMLYVTESSQLQYLTPFMVGNVRGS